MRDWDRGLLPALVGANAVKVAAFGAWIAGESHVQVFFYKCVVCAALGVLIARPLLLAKSAAPLVLFYLFQTAYLGAVLAYFRYSSNYLTLGQMSAMAGEGWNMAARQAIPLDPGLLLVAADLPILGLYLMRRGETRSHDAFWRSRWNPAALAALLLLAAVEAVNLKAGKSLWNPDNASEAASVVRRSGTLANSMVWLMNDRCEKGLIESFDYGPLIAGSPEPDVRPNFLLIQVESLGSNVLKAFYEGSPVVPNLRRLALEGIFHPYALCYHKGGGSSDAEFSVLNSVEPQDGFVSMKMSTYGYPNSLVRSLKEQGYGARGFHGNHREFYNRREAYHRMGFDRFHDMKDMGLQEKGWGAPDRDVFEFIGKRMREESGPFFYYAITMSSHQPFHFHLQGEDAGGFEKVRDPDTRDYLRSMAYTDRIIGAFVDRLRREGPPDTYILIFGDHPVPLDNGEYSNAGVWKDGAHLEFVPFILLTPRGDRRLDLGNVASYLDMAPTILAASGGGFRIRTRGNNLLAPLPPERELSLRTRVYKGSDLFRIASEAVSVESPFLEFPDWKEER